MAKARAGKRKGGKRGRQVVGLEPRPSYGLLRKEMLAMIERLTKIVADKKDQKGALSAAQLQKAADSIKALNAGLVLFDCPQLMGPYGD